MNSAALTPYIFDQKIVLITGAASGIGRACAEHFAACGARLAIVDIDLAAAQSFVAELTANNVEALAIGADVSDEASVASMIEQCVARFGGLDCAVNNAGITGNPTPLENVELSDWQRVIDVNITSVFLCLKYQLKQMKAQGHGAIVNLSSGAGVIPAPLMSPYCASKHAVLGLTKTAAMENVKNNIRINAVLPGSTRTPMLESTLALGEAVEQMILNSVPCGRFGTPQEIAEAVVWLCSDGASYINGHSLIADGGTLCR